ncbi:phage protein GemA/Gp16 family protein [Burkholderiaceae bacterium UC74_6]
MQAREYSSPGQREGAATARAAARPDAGYRRRTITAIHVSAAKLGMDTKDKAASSLYRSMLVKVGGQASTTDMTDEQLGAVLKHLLRTLNPGGQAKPKDGWHADKMRKLWADLAQLGAVRDSSDEGLRLFVQSQVGVSALRFLTSHQGNRIVEALKSWLARERVKAGKDAA